MSTQNNLDLDTTKDESSVSVVKYKHKLGSKDVEYAKVSRNTADLDSLLSLIDTYGAGVSRTMVLHCLSLFKRAVLEKLKLGRSVNILGLCIAYISATLDEDSNATLSVKLTPLDDIVEAVDGIETSVTEAVSKTPSISQITDFKTLKTGAFAAGNVVQLKGKYLKLADYDSSNKAGIYLASCDSDGVLVSNDKTTWIELANTSALAKNKPSEVIFTAPDTIDPGTYKLIVHTYLSGAQATSTLRSGEYEGIITFASSE